MKRKFKDWWHSGADPEGGGGVAPTPFCAKFFKKFPELAKKNHGVSPRTPCAPFFFQILDPILTYLSDKGEKFVYPYNIYCILDPWGGGWIS